MALAVFFAGAGFFFVDLAFVFVVMAFCTSSSVTRFTLTAAMRHSAHQSSPNQPISLAGSCTVFKDVIGQVKKTEHYDLRMTVHGAPQAASPLSFASSTRARKSICVSTSESSGSLASFCCCSTTRFKVCKSPDRTPPVSRPTFN